MKKLILLTLSIISLCAMNPKAKPIKRKASPEQISRQTFQDCKDSLPTLLKNFIADVRYWPKKDIDTITISGSMITVNGLNKDLQTKYQGNLGYWLDYQITQEPHQKENFITCLHYLKQQKVV